MIVVEAGFAVVTDLGRFAGPAMGLSVNGALDQHSARVANYLVGNPASAPLVELTASTLVVRMERDALVAISGAPAKIEVDGTTAEMVTPVAVPLGSTLRIEVGDQGLRSYLAIRGSVGIPMLLGSCAPDTMIGFGTRLAPGTELRQLISTPTPRNPFSAIPLFRLGEHPHLLKEEPRVAVTDGPDLHEFGESARELFARPYVVSPRSNHVGLRLTGPAPQRQTSAEVLSRGVPVGAIEVPSHTELLVLHRGRGVTAGYPVLGVISTIALDTMAQVRPGQRLRFHHITLQEASFLRCEQNIAEERFRRRCLDALRLNGVPRLAEVPLGAQLSSVAPSSIPEGAQS